MERTDGTGKPSENPAEYLIPELEDGVVNEAVFIERSEPAGLHDEAQMEEDDDFLSVGSEVCEYDITDGRDTDFTDALKNSQMVIDYEVIDETSDSE